MYMRDDHTKRKTNLTACLNPNKNKESSHLASTYNVCLRIHGMIYGDI